jgi:signal transduction histidine kinase
MIPVEAKSLPSTALCEMLQRQSPCCTWLLRRDLSFRDIYGTVFQILGRSAEELEKISFGDLFAPSLRAAWVARVERVFAGETLGGPAQFSGSAPECSIILFPVTDSTGEILFAGGTAHEISDDDLSLRTLQLLDAERGRLCQFLHDQVGQQLSAAGLQLDLLRMDLAASASPHALRAAAIQATLETVIDALRGFNSEFHPVTGGPMDLRAALDMLAGHLRANFPGSIRVWAGDATTTSPHVAAALYRIAQEAAGNALRHSGCTMIDLLLKSLREGPVLEIRDNGRGFVVADGLRARRMGFAVMRYQADRAGLELRIDSAPGKGTVIRVLCRQADGKMGGPNAI